MSDSPIIQDGELAQDEKAMQRYSILAKEEKRAIRKRAHNAKSEAEMRGIVMHIAGKR